MVLCVTVVTFLSDTSYIWMSLQVVYCLVLFLFFLFWRQKADMPTSKHMRQLTTLLVVLSSREEISQLGNELLTS